MRKVSYSKYAIAKVDNEYQTFVWPKYKISGHLYSQPLLMMVIAEYNQTQNTRVVIPVKEVKRLIHFDPSRHISFSKALEMAAEDANKPLKTELAEKGFKLRWIMNGFDYDPVENVVVAHLNKKIADTLFNPATHYTKSLVEDISTLKSFEARQLYYLLRQWRTVGHTRYYSKKFIITYFQVAKTYQRSSKLNSRIFRKAIKELERNYLFRNIKVVTTTDFAKVNEKAPRKKRGRKPIAGYRFFFTPQNSRVREMEDKDVTVTPVKESDNSKIKKNKVQKKDSKNTSNSRKIYDVDVKDMF